MPSIKFHVSRQGLHLIALFLLTAILSVARYKKTYWLAPNSELRLDHVEAARLTQSGKIPFAREYEENTTKPTGNITFKEDLAIYNHPLNPATFHE